MNVEYTSNYPSFENRDYYVDLGEHIAFTEKEQTLHRLN